MNTRRAVGRYRANDWFNTKTGEIYYGIDKVIDRKRVHLSEGKNPLFFKSDVERYQRMLEFYKRDKLVAMEMVK